MPRFALIVLLATLYASPILAEDRPAMAPRLVVQQGHKNQVPALAYSPDGRFIVTGGPDSTIRLWECGTGRLLRRIPTGPVYRVVVSPDGARILAGHWNSNVRLWDARSGELIREFDLAPARYVSVAFSPDGRTVLTAAQVPNGDDRPVRLWDVESGEDRHALTGNIGSAKAVGFTRDGQQVIAAGSSSTHVWDVAGGSEARRVEGTSLALSPDTRRMLVERNFELLVLELATGEVVSRFGRHEHRVASGTFTPDGRRILSGDREGAVWLWDAETGRGIRSLSIPEIRSERSEHVAGEVYAAAFSPDGRRVVAGGRGHAAVQQWDVATGRELRSMLGHAAAIGTVAYSTDGRRVLSAGGDETVRTWDPAEGTQVRRSWIGGYWVPVSFSPDRSAALVVEGPWARLRDLATGKEILRLEGHEEYVTASAF